MKQEIVMRGQTASGGTETLEFSGIQTENKNMAYKMTEFKIYPSGAIGAANYEMCGSVTAGKSAVDPQDPNFDNEGLISTAMFMASDTTGRGGQSQHGIVNDTFLITQNLILMVFEVNSTAVNWQCRFKAVKMTDAEMAANNFKQYMISDGS
jgi:hypothetical protein